MVVHKTSLELHSKIRSNINTAIILSDVTCCILSETLICDVFYPHKIIAVLATSIILQMKELDPRLKRKNGSIHLV